MAVVKLQNPDRRYQPSPVNRKSLSKIKLLQLQSVFLLLDSDRDGRLLWEQAKHGARLLGVRLETVESEYEDAGADEHLYNVDEFADIVATAIQRDHNAADGEEQELVRLFNAIDKRGKGRFAAAELSAFFRTCGDDVPEDVVQAMMDAMDTTLDGQHVGIRDLGGLLKEGSRITARPDKLRMPSRPFSLHGDFMQQLLNASLDPPEARAPSFKRPSVGKLEPSPEETEAQLSEGGSEESDSADSSTSSEACSDSECTERPRQAISAGPSTVSLGEATSRFMDVKFADENSPAPIRLSETDAVMGNRSKLMLQGLEGELDCAKTADVDCDRQDVDIEPGPVGNA